MIPIVYNDSIELPVKGSYTEGEIRDLLKCAGLGHKVSKIKFDLKTSSCSVDIHNWNGIIRVSRANDETNH